MIDPLIIRTMVNVTVPAIYSDALSYQDMIAILQSKINECIKEINGLTGEEIEAVITTYLTPEKIQEIIEGGFGDYVGGKIDTALSDYWDADMTGNKIGTATSEMQSFTYSYVAGQLAPIATSITNINSNLENNYDTSSEVDDKIAAAVTDLTDYYTKDETDIEIGIAVNEEATARDAAISTAITTNNASYYNKSQVDSKDSSNRTYTDNAVSTLRDEIAGDLSFVDWLSENETRTDWETKYGDPHSTLAAYDSILSDVSDVLMESRADHVDGASGVFTLNGELRLTSGNISSGASIHAQDTCALMLLPYAVRADIKTMVNIINTGSGERLLSVPMVISPAGSYSVLLYKYVSDSVTPNFTCANKRLYINVSGYYEA